MPASTAADSGTWTIARGSSASSRSARRASAQRATSARGFGPGPCPACPAPRDSARSVDDSHRTPADPAPRRPRGCRGGTRRGTVLLPGREPAVARRVRLRGPDHGRPRADPGAVAEPGARRPLPLAGRGTATAADRARARERHPRTAALERLGGTRRGPAGSRAGEQRVAAARLPVPAAGPRRVPARRRRLGRRADRVEHGGDGGAVRRRPAPVPHRRAPPRSTRRC